VLTAGRPLEAVAWLVLQFLAVNVVPLALVCWCPRRDGRTVRLVR
jgi:hypothetical protein